jgi:hypothetical protein
MTNYDRVSNWLTVAGKQPNQANLSVQVGVHIEEFVEFLETLDFDDDVLNLNLEDAAMFLAMIGTALKKQGEQVFIKDRVACLDSLCDQDVTLNGVSFLAGFDKNGADKAVLDSNDSKFFEGKALILAGGKIGKGPNYVAPDLTPFV